MASITFSNISRVLNHYSSQLEQLELTLKLICCFYKILVISFNGTTAALIGAKCGGKERTVLSFPSQILNFISLINLLPVHLCLLPQTAQSQKAQPILLCPFFESLT